MNGKERHIAIYDNRSRYNEEVLVPMYVAQVSEANFSK